MKQDCDPSFRKSTYLCSEQESIFFALLINVPKKARRCMCSFYSEIQIFLSSKCFKIDQYIPAGLLNTKFSK